jgi:hypothetical protein
MSMTFSASESAFHVELMPESAPSQVTNWRARNLRALVHAHGGFAALARELGYSNHSAISHLAGKKPTRPISETVARRIENKLGLPRGMLDEPPQSFTTEVAASDDDVRRLIGAAAVKTMSRVLYQNGLRLPPECEIQFMSLVLRHVEPIGSR